MPKVLIDLDRCDRVYVQNDKVKGKVIFVDVENNLNHGGVTLSAWGTVKLSVRQRIKAIRFHF